MKVCIQWVGEVMFFGEFGSGYVVVMDGLLDYGGCNFGVCFMEMVLIGFGGCINFDVVSILKKVCQLVESCEVFFEVERVDEEFKVFMKIYVYFVVKGCGFKEVQVKCVVELLVEKYCLVLIMFGCGGVEIIYDYEIVEFG